VAEPSDVAEQWEVVDSEVLADTGWVVTLRADRVRRPGHPDDEPFRRFVLEHPGAAVILALDTEDRVFCLRQYRHAAGRRFVELPAGLLDVEGEGAEQAARRELVEEAGLEATEWTHLGTTYGSPGISQEVHHLYLARGLSEVDNDFVAEHEEADMSTEWIGFDDLLAAVLDGRVQDGPVVQAVLLARARGLA
jgi:ADP-ribose pyrophosphatase